MRSGDSCAGSGGSCAGAGSGGSCAGAGSGGSCGLPHSDGSCGLPHSGGSCGSLHSGDSYAGESCWACSSIPYTEIFLTRPPSNCQLKLNL